MKIVIDARKIKSTTGRYVEELARNLESIDHTNHYQILVLPDEKDYYKPNNPNFQVIVADFKHYSFAEQLGFNNFLRNLKADLVHFYMPQQPLLYTRPSVTTIHDLSLLRVTANDMGSLELLIKKKIFAGLLQVVAHRTKHVITPTQFTKDDLIKFAHISPNKITVTYEGAIKARALQPLSGYEKMRFIVYLGRAEPYKNNRRMIEAHQTLLKMYPDLHLVIVGAIDNLRQTDMQWVKDNGYKNVDFTGWLSDEQAAWLYRRAVAFVQPSLMEGFGLPALEAMLQGLPVVSSSATCLPEVYGKAAHYFEPTDMNDITRAIQEVLGDDGLRQTLITNGKEQAKKYSWRAMAEQTLSVYLDALGKGCR